MNLKKRGLGRGLEALLAETPEKPDEVAQQPVAEPEQLALAPRLQAHPVPKPDSINKELLNQSAFTIELIKNVQRENLRLQEEAVLLKSLLDELAQLLLKLN